MLIPSASQSILRTATLLPALHSSSTRICLRHALHNNSLLLRSRVSPVHKFHTTSFPSATHTHIRRDWRPPGRFQRYIRRFNSIPRYYIIFGILGINGVVFAAWTYVQMFHVRLTPSSLQFHRVFATHSVQRSASGFGVPPPDVKWLVRWLQDNFVNSYENLRRGRLYVAVQSAIYIQYS